MIQRVMIKQHISGQDGARSRWTCLEEWVFQFGFVIPGSTNSWQSVVESARDGRGKPSVSSTDMKGAKFVIETHFYDDKVFVCKDSVGVRYV